MIRILTSAQAISEALAIAGKRDKNVLLMGQGIDDKGAFYGTTADLRPIYGDRLIETPVSENAMVGVAIGLAISGKRPVIQFHRVEFALLAMEQLINNAAKMHYISNGQHKCPIVIRMIVGRGWGQGPCHSQSMEAMFAYIPGLKVLMPTFPADYKGMLLAAVEDDNPVVIIEHRWTHYVQGQVPDGYWTRDITKPERLRKGTDVTIVASSYMTLESMAAAAQLADNDVQAEVFDLRVARQLNMAEIRRSVDKTGRLLVVDTGYRTLGIGAEIIASIAEGCFSTMIAPARRIGLPAHPVPSSRGYLSGLYPDAHLIFDTVADMLNLADLEFKQDSVLPLDVPNKEYQGPF